MKQKTAETMTTLTKRIAPIVAARLSPNVSVNVDSACETRVLRSLLTRLVFVLPEQLAGFTHQSRDRQVIRASALSG